MAKKMYAVELVIAAMVATIMVTMTKTILSEYLIILDSYLVVTVLAWAAVEDGEMAADAAPLLPDVAFLVEEFHGEVTSRTADAREESLVIERHTMPPNALWPFQFRNRFSAILMYSGFSSIPT